jgi:hypothetical protein
MLDGGEVFQFLHSYIIRCMLASNITCLTPPTIHVMCDELVAKVLKHSGECQSSNLATNTSTSQIVNGKWLLVGWMSSWNMNNFSFFQIPLSKKSHIAYSRDPYKMSHLHNFPCPTKYSHCQSRDMSKIPTLSTFPSKPYEPRDMKGNFGKFPHWDTSESSMCLTNTWKSPEQVLVGALE